MASFSAWFSKMSGGICDPTNRLRGAASIEAAGTGAAAGVADAGTVTAESTVSTESGPSIGALDRPRGDGKGVGESQSSNVER